MITDLIINVIFAIPYALLSSMQGLDFNLELPSNFFNTLENLSSGVGYVIPVAKLLPIFVVTIALYSFRIVWAIIIRVKSFIPTMGG